MTTRWRVARAAVPLLVPLCFLVSRPPASGVPPSGMERVHLAGPLHVWVNTDSADFVSVALQPSKLFSDGEPMQSRPVVVAAAAALSYPFRSAMRALHPASRIDTTAARRSFAPGGDANVDDAIAAYAAYVLFNAIFLLGALVLFWRAVGDRPSWAAAALALVVGGNRVTKAFFWTPHLQILNVLLPLAAVELARRTLARPLSSWRGAALTGMAIGIAALGYGAAAALLVALLAAQLLSRRPGQLRVVVGAVGGFMAPIVAWVAVVVAVNGTYYNHEARVYRQFVWVIDSARDGALGTAVLANLRRFWAVTVPVLWLPTILLAVVALLSTGRGPFSADTRRRLVAAGLGFLAMLVFYGPLGVYAQRLSWSLVPPLLVAVAVLAHHVADLSGRALRVAVVVMVAAFASGSVVNEVVRGGLST